MSEGLSFEEIIRDYYLDLQIEDVRACVQYAIDVVAAEDVHNSGADMKSLLSKRDKRW